MARAMNETQDPIKSEMQDRELEQGPAQTEVLLAQYIDLYDFAPVGYVTVSEAGLILKANILAATLLGAPRSVLAGKPLARFISPEDQGIYHCHRLQLFGMGRSQACELRMVRPDSGSFWARMDTTVARYAAGVAPVGRVTMTDITARRRLDEQIRQLNADLERRVRERTAEFEQATTRLQQREEQFRTTANFPTLESACWPRTAA